MRRCRGERSLKSHKPETQTGYFIMNPPPQHFKERECSQRHSWKFTIKRNLLSSRGRIKFFHVYDYVAIISPKSPKSQNENYTNLLVDKTG